MAMGALAAARPRVPRLARVAPPVFARVLAAAGPDGGATASALEHAALLADAGERVGVLDLGPMAQSPRHRENPRREEAGPPADLLVTTPEGAAGLFPNVPVLYARGPARPYRRILVAADMSAGCRRALRLAARLATLFGAEVIVQQIVPPAHGEESARASLGRFLPRELARLGPRLAVERGKPDVALLKSVEHYAPDLAVVPGGAGLDIARIVRHAPCPVLVA